MITTQTHNFNHPLRSQFASKLPLIQDLPYRNGLETIEEYIAHLLIILMAWSLLKTID